MSGEQNRQIPFGASRRAISLEYILENKCFTYLNNPVLNLKWTMKPFYRGQTEPQLLWRFNPCVNSLERYMIAQTETTDNKVF